MDTLCSHYCIFVGVYFELVCNVACTCDVTDSRLPPAVTRPWPPLLQPVSSDGRRRALMSVLRSPDCSGRFEYKDRPPPPFSPYCPPWLFFISTALPGAAVFRAEPFPSLLVLFLLLTASHSGLLLSCRSWTDLPTAPVAPHVYKRDEWKLLWCKPSWNISCIIFTVLEPAACWQCSRKFSQMFSDVLLFYSLHANMVRPVEPHCSHWEVRLSGSVLNKSRLHRSV